MHSNVKEKVRAGRQSPGETMRGRCVPQIWMTYEELAGLMGCDRAQARSAAAAIGLDRRRSRDGQTRAKLTPALSAAFLDGLLRQRLDQEIAACAGDLHAMRARAAMRPALAPTLCLNVAS
jgi:hypothetical protein